jgi:hypothetical protein
VALLALAAALAALAGCSSSVDPAGKRPSNSAATSPRRVAIKIGADRSVTLMADGVTSKTAVTSAWKDAAQVGAGAIGGSALASTIK